MHVSRSSFMFSVSFCARLSQACRQHVETHGFNDRIMSRQHKNKLGLLIFQLEIHRFHWSQASHHVRRVMQPVQVKTSFANLWHDVKLPDMSKTSRETATSMTAPSTQKNTCFLCFYIPIGNTSIPLIPSFAPCETISFYACAILPEDRNFLRRLQVTWNFKNN